MAIALTDHTAGTKFTPAVLWHRKSARGLLKQFSSGNADGQWAIWRKHLAQRHEPMSPPFLRCKSPAILWAWPESWARGELCLTTASLGGWQADFVGGRSGCIDLMGALQAVTAAYALPALAAELSGSAWWQLAESLHALAGDAQQIHVDLASEPQDVVRQQLLAGELPLALGYLFPELRPMRDIRRPARQTLSEALVSLTDGEGLPHGRLLSVLGPLWACWTRSRWLGRRMKGGAWSRDAETQYRWLIRRAIQLANGKHGFVLTGNGADSHVPELDQLVRTALSLAGDKRDCAAAAQVVGKSVVPKIAHGSLKKLPKASVNSEWSGLAVVASGWKKSDPRLAVNYADHPLTMELRVGGERLLAGHWTSSTLCDGQPVTPTGKWELLCWLSEKGCDFLELGIELTEDLHLERQIVLAKRDDVLLIADTIASNDDSSHQLRHTFNLPLATDVVWQPETETRDGTLVVGKHRTAILPLALAEWRSDPRGGNFSSSAERLTLSQEAVGRALYCPLLFDLKRGRSAKERTWRQLTVAEALEVVPRDAAIGFRAQSCDDQWLVYRSLGKAGNRTVLGQNISTEFCAGRFRKNGLMKEWIEIEAE